MLERLAQDTHFQTPGLEEKVNDGSAHLMASEGSENPVLSSAKFICERTDLVKINPEGVRNAAHYIHKRILQENYTPSTWRTHPLHLLPPPHFTPTSPLTKATIDWIFLISSLNFSFWSEYQGTPKAYAVEWRAGWGEDAKSKEKKVWTGYWSLVAALNRALEEGIPITDPRFYASEEQCPDSLIAHVFRAAPGCAEGIPLLDERIKIMREVGTILCQSYNATFLTILTTFQANPTLTALDLVKTIVTVFPSFRDECIIDGQRVMFWKRAQILVAEIWAAFYPLAESESESEVGIESEEGPGSGTSSISSENSQASSSNPPSTSTSESTTPDSSYPPTPTSETPPTLPSPSPSSSHPSPHHHHHRRRLPLPAHPLFPHGITPLTMFADYRVPQLLHHLRILTYAPSLTHTLASGGDVRSGGWEEVGVRAGSVLGVECVREVMCELGRRAVGANCASSARESESCEIGSESEGESEGEEEEEISSVLIDFYLWDLAKRIERGDESLENEGFETTPILPAHRTRSIWY